MNQAHPSQNHLPTFHALSDFGKELKSLRHVWLREKIKSPNADLWHWMRGLLVLGLGGMAYYLLFWANVGAPIYALLLTLFAFCCFGLLMVFGHDASHGALSKHRWVNDWAVFLPFAVNGVSGAMWKDRHVRLHHTMPNVPGTEIDAYSSNVIRLSPLQPWKPYHRFQMLYAPIGLLFGMLFLVWIEDVVSFVQQRRQQGARRPRLDAFLATKGVHVSIFLLIPLLFSSVPWWAVLLTYVCITVIVSAIFVVLVVGTHVSDLTLFPEPDEETRELPNDWASLQVVTTVDWSPHSTVAAWFTGGSNAHLAHHLFPSVSHSHSAHLSKLIAELAKKHGLNYREVPFHEMALGTLRLIYQLSFPPKGVDRASVEGRLSLHENSVGNSEGAVSK